MNLTEEEGGEKETLDEIEINDMVNEEQEIDEADKENKVEDDQLKQAEKLELDMKDWEMYFKKCLD